MIWPFKKAAQIPPGQRHAVAEDMLDPNWPKPTQTPPMPPVKERVKVKKQQLKVHLDNGDWFGLLSIPTKLADGEEGAEPGDPDDVYDDFIAWVEKPQPARAPKAEFFRLKHKDGYELIRHSTIKRVSVNTIWEYE